MTVTAQGKRYALPNTRIMLHHPSGSARGQASDINNEARELMRLRNYVNQVLSQATGKPIEKVRTPKHPCFMSCIAYRGRASVFAAVVRATLFHVLWHWVLYQSRQ